MAQANSEPKIHPFLVMPLESTHAQNALQMTVETQMVLNQRLQSHLPKTLLFHVMLLESTHAQNALQMTAETQMVLNQKNQSLLLNKMVTMPQLTISQYATTL